MRELEAKGKISDKWKKQYCESYENWKNCKRFQMEEKGIAHDDILPNGEKLNNLEDDK